uniref:Uncharacterized protein n=1 Tax=Cacopsylla melanoneura TaxID=428564 RepID=A0A8D8RJV1_9HEMI
MNASFTTTCLTNSFLLMILLTKKSVKTKLFIQQEFMLIRENFLGERRRVDLEDLDEEEVEVTEDLLCLVEREGLRGGVVAVICIGGEVGSVSWCPAARTGAARRVSVWARAWPGADSSVGSVAVWLGVVVDGQIGSGPRLVLDTGDSLGNL